MKILWSFTTLIFVQNFFFLLAAQQFEGVKLAVRDFGSVAGQWQADKHLRLLGDVDGDARVDIVGFGNDGVYVSLGQADGSFSSPILALRNFGYLQEWLIDKHPRLLGDVNGDGRVDIVGFGHDGVYVSLAQSNASFSPSILAVRNFGYLQEWRIDKHPRLLGDVDGDGRIDIVGFSFYGVFVSLGQVDGSFSSATLILRNFAYLAGGWGVDKHPRLLGDVDGDGRIDIVGFGTSGTYASRGLSSGYFEWPKFVVQDFGYHQQWRIDKHPRLLGDVDGDGRIDIVGFGTSGVHVSRALSNRRYKWPTLVVRDFGYAAGGWDVNKHPRLIGDVNGDGKDDIVGFGNSGVYVALAQNDGYFGWPTFVISNFGYLPPAGNWSVEENPRFLGDVNGDGQADIVGFGNDGVYVALAK